MNNNLQDPVLVKWDIDYADEFNCPGFRIFSSLSEAEYAISQVVESSANDDDWFYFGTNEAVGTIPPKDFTIIKITKDQATVLQEIFGNKPRDPNEAPALASFGMLTGIFDHC